MAYKVIILNRPKNTQRRYYVEAVTVGTKKEVESLKRLVSHSIPKSKFKYSKV